MADLPTVVVAMSGGVDSSVAAALLKRQGYRVVGMMLRLWSEEGHEGENRCCTPDAMAQARRVAAQLGIPFYALDVRAPFRQVVVQSFLDGYSNGQTPNPCIACNRYIRWGFLLEQAKVAGANYLATGHYARLQRYPGEPVKLLRAIDLQKDQSYVLSSLNQAQLAQTLLPLGELTKPEVREIARSFNLPVAERPDSQDLCFLAGEDYREFLTRHSPGVAIAGPIVDLEGQVIGEHQGLAFYTIGQRKGLGIAAAEPYYVVTKDVTRNRLVIGRQAQLGRQIMTVRGLNWISGVDPQPEFDAEVKIRYKAAPAKSKVYLEPEGRARVEFMRPLRDITAGQLAVIYQDEQVLGSGFIED